MLYDECNDVGIKAKGKAEAKEDVLRKRLLTTIKVLIARKSHSYFINFLSTG